jgi:[acyl-carrier-protein] S-malonyltransferase
MGRDLYDAFPSAKEVFDQADEALGFNLTSLCFYGPAEELRQTINAQPAILTTSIACLAAAAEAGCLDGGPVYMAGHSLGEFTAMVATSALDFEEGVRLVRERGRLMQEAGISNPGTMAAIIGLEESAVEEVCLQAGSEICNLNSPNQIVVGGAKEAIVRAMEMAKARGASRVIPLNVNGAFHSSLMKPAAEKFAEVLSEAPFEDPEVPIVANTTAKPLTTARELKDESLRQLTAPVHWQRSVLYMMEQKIDTMVEIGPGNVLTGLIKRIASNVHTMNLNNESSIREQGKK